MIGSVKDDIKEHCKSASTTENAHENVVEDKEGTKTTLVFRLLVTSNDSTEQENKKKISKGKSNNEIKRRDRSSRNVVYPLTDIIRKITAVVCMAFLEGSPIAETWEFGAGFRY